MSTPSTTESYESSSSDEMTSEASTEAMATLRLAREKLLRRIIDGSSMSLAGKVMLKSLTSEDCTEAVQAIAEGRNYRISGGSTAAHLLRAVVHFEQGNSDDARYHFTLAGGRAMAWFGYGLLEKGDDRLHAFHRAVDLAPSIATDCAVFTDGAPVVPLSPRGTTTPKKDDPRNHLQGE